MSLAYYEADHTIHCVSASTWSNCDDFCILKDAISPQSTKLLLILSDKIYTAAEYL